MDPNSPNLKQTVPFLRVSSMQQSLEYYVHGLGFEMTDSWEVAGQVRWCWLQQGGAALMLQEFPTEGQDAWKPVGPVGQGVSIYFICEDALSIYRQLTQRGVQADRPFVGNAMWVVSLLDPDGYQLYFESPTAEAEETQYLPDSNSDP